MLSWLPQNLHKTVPRNWLTSTLWKSVVVENLHASGSIRSISVFLMNGVSHESVNNFIVGTFLDPYRLLLWEPSKDPDFRKPILNLKSSLSDLLYLNVFPKGWVNRLQDQTCCRKQCSREAVLCSSWSGQRCRPPSLQRINTFSAFDFWLSQTDQEFWLRLYNKVRRVLEEITVMADKLIPLATRRKKFISSPKKCARSFNLRMNKCERDKNLSLDIIHWF